MTRLPPQDGERIERGRELSFSFDGKEVTGLEGDTIGSALYASGQARSIAAGAGALAVRR